MNKQDSTVQRQASAIQIYQTKVRQIYIFLIPKSEINECVLEVTLELLNIGVG